MRSRFGLLAMVGAALSPGAAEAQLAGPDYEGSMKAALVVMTVDRLADVCRSKGTTAVSPMTTDTLCNGAPSASAASWAKIVRAP